MRPYIMKSQVDCGPAALSAVLGMDEEKILEAWPGGWIDIASDTGKLGLPNDTPSDHEVLLKKLGVTMRVVTCGEILTGSLPMDKVIVLLHKPGSFMQSMLAQHWAVINSVDADGVNIHMGNGKVRRFTIAEFQTYYAAGWPACAYVIGEESVEPLSWWRRFLNWLVRRI